MSGTCSHVVRLLAQLAENPSLVAIRRGFLLLLPLIMLGAFSFVLGHMVLPEVFDSAALSEFQRACGYVGETVFGVISLCLVMTVSHSLAAQHRADLHDDIHPMIPAIVSLLAFLALVAPFDGRFSGELFGVRTVFPALLVSITATTLFLRLGRISRFRPGSMLGDADPALPGVLQSVIPAFATISAFLAIRMTLGSTEARPVLSLMDDILLSMFGAMDSDLLRALLFNLVNHLLWFVGAHGSNILSVVEGRYLDAATAINAVRVYAPALPEHIITKPLLDVFVLMGGSGTSLGLVVAVLINWRGSNQHRLARLGLLPALFNVSELMVFGLPIVFNPVFLIPFVLTPLVLTLTSYAACASGWIPAAYQSISWTTPLLIGGYLVAQSWHGMALQVFNLLVAVLIYTPFVRAARRQMSESRRRDFKLLINAMEESSLNQRSGILERTDTIGIQARYLSGDLRYALRDGQLRLVFQPQVDCRGVAVGVEALLRWNHPLLGNIQPNIVVAIAEESDLICELGDWVADQACGQLKRWQTDCGVHDVVMSINISPTQLHDSAFAERMKALLEVHALSAERIELELTESRAVAHDESTVESMTQLARAGFRLAIDDFGMGYSSLLYMRRFSVDAVKLDGSLTREVETNQSCQEIIKTVSHLCHKKNIRIIAEFVETEEQRRLLQALGCTEYQGYLFSKPLPADECLGFILSRNACVREAADEPATPAASEIAVMKQRQGEAASHPVDHSLSQARLDAQCLDSLG